MTERGRWWRTPVLALAGVRLFAALVWRFDPADIAGLG
jgi:hypothetical protein